MKRVAVILLILVVVVGVSVAGYQFLTPEPYSIADDPDVEVIEIQRDTILATINAAGRIQPEAEVQVNFEGNGVVAEVLVERGQYVTAGTILARLETDDLELAMKRAHADLARAEAQFDQLFQPALSEEVASARAAMESAQANLDQVLAGPREDEIASAQAAVESAQANLDQVLAGPREDEIASARSAVESAQASLERALEGPSEDDITVAAANLRRAEIALKQAQWAYDQVAYMGEIGAMPQASQLEQATLDYETALANYNLAVQGPTEADIAAARSQLAQAESSLAQLLESPTEAEIAAAGSQLTQAEGSLAQLLESPTEAEIAAARSQLAQTEAGLAQLLEEPGEAEVLAAQASVDAARFGLEQAELNLAEASLVAPVDGVVMELNVKRGERPPGEAALILTDVSVYHIDVEVDEIDIGRITRGQSVVIALDAIPDEDFTGHVADISPGPIQGVSSGIVAYEVTITLDSDDPRLLPGMTADATIETERLEKVLVVPNRAVSIDRSSGEPVAKVEKVDEDGNPVLVDIELGLRDEAKSQILDGLEEGDQIVIRGLSRREQLQRAFQGEE